MNLIYSLFAVIIALVGGFFYMKSRNDAVNALLQNQDTKNKLNQIDQTINKNNGLLLSEEEKRKQLEQEMKDKEKQNASQDELLRFLNSKSDKQS